MDLCKEDDITEQDHVEEWPEGFKVVIDPKSMLYLFGLELGYSNSLWWRLPVQKPNAEGRGAGRRSHLVACFYVG